MLDFVGSVPILLGHKIIGHLKTKPSSSSFVDLFVENDSQDCVHAAPFYTQTPWSAFGLQTSRVIFESLGSFRLYVISVKLSTIAVPLTTLLSDMLAVALIRSAKN